MSIKENIIQFLEQNYGDKWCFAGKIDDYIRDLKGSKASNVSRRCRELVKSGVLEVIYEQVEGKGPKCAKYRVVNNMVEIKETYNREGEMIKLEYNGIEQETLI